MNRLSIRELIDIANQAGVLKRMGTEQLSKVVVDHIPARASWSIAREKDGAALEAIAGEVIPVTFTLESAMFGGAIFAAITCGERVVVHPFPWTSYEHLASVTINITP